jgi:hypothetical protein
MAPGWKADCGRSVTKICPANVPHVGQGVVGRMRDDRNLTKHHLGRGTTRPGLGEADRGFVSRVRKRRSRVWNLQPIALGHPDTAAITRPDVFAPG